MSDRRPDPDALLAEARRETERAGRGKLKIWLGAAPGVGKTFAMLDAARRRARDGADLVVGVVETHGRAETEALLLGLETLPRRRIEYRGRTLAEFDLDAALTRRPALILVDELAHTNAPGSRHGKRWNDVRELLDAGIDVWTTLNVQHLASLIDVVEQLLGVRVHETVPDEVFDAADDVELVDLPPELLIERLRDGKVYLADSAARAAEGFFVPAKLSALRELALRRTARWVDTRRRESRRAAGDARGWTASERVLVCVGPSPLSATLLRTAYRLANASHAELLAVHVQPAGGAHDAAAAARVGQNLRIAESLGARTFTIESHDPAAAVVELAREHGVARIVVGKSGLTRWRERVLGSFVQDLLRASGEIDVLVIRGRGDERAPSPSLAHREDTEALRAPHDLGRCVQGAAIVAAAIAGAWLVYAPPDLSVEALVLLLGVVVVAYRHGRVLAMLAALFCALAFNFLLTEPRFTFAIDDPTYLVAFFAMLAGGLLTSSLVVRVREQGRITLARERETAALFSLTRELARVQSAAEIARVTVAHLDDAAAAPTAVLMPAHEADDAPLAVTAPQAGAPWLSARDLGVARWVWERGLPAGAGSAQLGGVPGTFLPLRTARGRAGVLAVLPRRDGRPHSLGERALLDTVAGLAGLALERVELMEARQRAVLDADRERLKSTLLTSVSHDLRTPLATICGATGALLASVSTGVDGTARELAQAIHDEARRLDELVGNLVFATRLDAGRVELRLQWTSVEDIVATAVRRSRPRLREHPLTVSVAGDLPLVSADAVLLEQALANLLDNVARHTPAGTAVSVSAEATPVAVLIRVRDDGPGVALSRESRDGLGLGLSICKGILRAHGGTAVVGAGPLGTGTEVLLTIPRPSEAPAVPAEPTPHEGRP